MPNPKTSRRISLIATNQLLMEACVFARNIIIARLMGAETLGQFVFLVLSIRLFAMSTDLAVERYILQVKPNNLEHALGSAHFISRFLGTALMLLLLLMGAYQVQGISLEAYAALAVSAFIRGYTHKGYVLKQRSLNFRPALYVEGLTAVAGLGAVYFVASAAPSLEAVCACLVAQSFLHTGLSHALSDGKYKSAIEITELKKIFRFGWPLLLTGVTMFWSMQGERLILSAMLPADEFAHFSMMFQLALVPILVMSRMALSYGLPVFAASKNDDAAFEARLDGFHRWVYAIGIAYALGFILFANVVLQTLFGGDFSADIGLVFLVAIAQMLRLFRAPQSIAAQALGQTDIPFKANLVRVSFVLIAIATIMNDVSLNTVLILACVGEGFAWATQGLFFALRNRNRMSPAEPQLVAQENV